MGLLRHVAVPALGPLARLHGQAIDVRHRFGTAGHGAGSRPDASAGARRRAGQRSSRHRPRRLPLWLPPCRRRSAPTSCEAAARRHRDRRRARDDRSRRRGPDARRTAEAEDGARLDRQRTGGARHRARRTTRTDRSCCWRSIRSACTSRSRAWSEADPALPNHRTPFTVVEGPRTLEAGKDALDVTFVAESGGVKLAKTYSFPRGRYDATVRHEVTNVGDGAGHAFAVPADHA